MDKNIKEALRYLSILHGETEAISGGEGVSFETLPQCSRACD